MDEKFAFSLLWLDYERGRNTEHEVKSGRRKLFNQELLERDMNMDMILDGMQIRNDSRGYIRARMLDMIPDAEVIKYRQDILQDFMDYPELEESFDTTLLPLTNTLRKMEKANISHDDDMRRIAWRIEMLEVYMQCVDVLHSLFCSPDRDFLSAGVRRLREMIGGIYDSQNYKDLRYELPKLSEKIQTMSSVTLGVNLDNELRPVEAVLLSIEPKPFKNKALVTSILGRQRNDETYFGLGSFYSILKDNRANTLDIAIMRDLESVMGDTFRHLATVLGRFEYIETQFLFDLIPEVYYFIGGSRLARNLMKTGLPVCFPTPAPKDERVFYVKDI